MKSTIPRRKKFKKYKPGGLSEDLFKAARSAKGKRERWRLLLWLNGWKFKQLIGLRRTRR